LLFNTGPKHSFVAEAANHVQAASIDSSGESMVEDYPSSSSSSSSSSFRVSSLAPVSLEGIELPVHHNLDGKILYRNGHGVRSFTFYGLSMKMYVASLYSEIPLRSEEDVLTCDGCSLLFDFVFLRGVGQGKVKLAWQKQLEWSVTHAYKGYKQDRDAFVNMFGPMEYKGTVTVKIVREETLILDQGTVRGSIKGVDFQRAFLTMWFGEKAVANDLKIGLLGNCTE
jgi:hypothetical protein